MHVSQRTRSLRTGTAHASRTRSFIFVHKGSPTPPRVTAPGAPCSPHAAPTLSGAAVPGSAVLLGGASEGTGSSDSGAPRVKEGGAGLPPFPANNGRAC